MARRALFRSEVRAALRWAPAAAFVLAAGALSSGCGLLETGANLAIRSQTIVAMRNTNTPVSNTPDVAAEMAQLYQRGLTDAYFDFWTRRESDPFDAKAADPVATAIWCTGKRLTPNAEPRKQSDRPCFQRLFTKLGLPAQDPTLALAYEPKPQPKARLERDIIRVETVLEASVFAAVTFMRSNYPADLRVNDPDDALPVTEPAAKVWQEVRKGVQRGLERFTTYQVSHARFARRDLSPSAIVLSGGAGNGAFSTGGIWFLLHQVAKKPALSTKARVDMVAAASTGALIGILIKDFYSGGPERQRAALDTMTDSYLCKSDADLYCVTNAGVIDLGITGSAGSETGLVRFSGVSRLLDAHIDSATFASPVEYFASATEFKSGRLFDFSSADPGDITDVASLKQAVLSSIPEPGMAEPMYHVGKNQGFFIDGGIRSGLPVLPPILGGAEHMVAFVNQRSDMFPLKDYPPNALASLFRSIDLFTFQPIVGELSQGEFELATRRSAEYELCMDRSEARAAAQGLPFDYDRANRFCTYRRPDEEPLGGLRGKAVLHALEPLYQSSQVFQPRDVPQGFERFVGTDLVGLNAAGYSFNPEVMFRQFALGAATVLERCEEIATSLGWLPDTDFACEKPDDLMKELDDLRAKLTAEGCYQKSSALRICGPDDPPVDPL
ncbi:MAG TPA: patatin-like phospholipase family protein [Polyangiaceae bacterium]|nr:patatin-like phospholipase family protein [Polyangiaceae bacterium]